jgi:hypothetical protein
MPKTQMRRYAAQWKGLPVPRLQLRWGPKPVPNSDPKRQAALRRDKALSKQMGLPSVKTDDWDCFYELVLGCENHTRDDHYGVGFIIVPISWTRRGSSKRPCEFSPIDDVFRDGAHAFWDSKAMGWLPIFVVAPDGTATMKACYHEQPKDWPALASAIEARRAETGTGSVEDESAAPKEDAQTPSRIDGLERSDV